MLLIRWFGEAWRRAGVWLDNIGSHRRNVQVVVQALKRRHSVVFEILDFDVHYLSWSIEALPARDRIDELDMHRGHSRYTSQKARPMLLDNRFDGIVLAWAARILSRNRIPGAFARRLLHGSAQEDYHGQIDHQKRHQQHGYEHQGCFQDL